MDWLTLGMMVLIIILIMPTPRGGGEDGEGGFFGQDLSRILGTSNLVAASPLRIVDGQRSPLLPSQGELGVLTGQKRSSRVAVYCFVFHDSIYWITTIRMMLIEQSLLITVTWPVDFHDKLVIDVSSRFSLVSVAGGKRSSISYNCLFFVPSKCTTYNEVQFGNRIIEIVEPEDDCQQRVENVLRVRFHWRRTSEY